MRISSHLNFQLVLIWSWSLLASTASAATVKGDFQLSGVNTEHVLASFAVAPENEGTVVLSLVAKHAYTDDRQLRFRMYRDDKWKSFLKAPSCAEKIPNAHAVEAVTFRPDGKGKYRAQVAMKIEKIKDEDRNHYYYFVLDDCSLEMYMHDAAIPKIHFSLQLYNGGSHLSADQEHLKPLHIGTFILSSIVAVMMGLSIVIQLVGKASNVHIAMFWVMAAASCDAASSLCEILHLLLYIKDGVGSYALDATSAHLEALCDSLVALLLLTVAAGWTLPSDVIPVAQNASPVQRILGGLRSPFTALVTCSPTAVLAIGILVSHVILAQWGRIYNDDFDSYHELEHLPGKILMAIRILLGICLIICTVQTGSRSPSSIKKFYAKLAFVGTLWFQSLPFITWFCNMFVPYHLRHWTVAIWGAGLQTSSIVALSWLVTAHSTSYHKLSHMTTKESLTDSLTTTNSSTAESSMGFAGEAARTWKLGKSKVRLD